MFIYDVNAEIQRKGNSYLCIYVNGKDFFSSHSRNRKIGWALFNPLIKLNFNFENNFNKIMWYYEFI